MLSPGLVRGIFELLIEGGRGIEKEEVITRACRLHFHPVLGWRGSDLSIVCRKEAGRV
jgi:hypothetical protein